MEKRTLYPHGQFYKGNLHAHTTCSDGEGTPWQVAEHYRNQGYSFLAITDHWFYGTYQEFNREDFLMFPGTELDIELPERKDHHLVGFGLPGSNQIPRGYQFEEERKAHVLTTPERIIEYFGQRGNVTLYAHPYWSKVDTGDIKNLHGLLGMEIYNHGAEFETNNGNSEVYFDQFLFGRNRLYCFGTDDSHNLGPNSIGGFVMVKSWELSHQAIFTAMKEGSFYASSGPLIHDFYVKDGTAWCLCGPSKDIYFQTPHRRGHLHDDGCGLTAGTFDLAGNEEYVRVTVVDEKGKKAWSQPIWLWI